MYVVVEEWSPKPAFLSASPERRAAFFEALTAGISDMDQAGVTALGWGRIDPSSHYGTPHRWFAVWQLRDRKAADFFLAAVATSGWYDYFDQTNIQGELRPAADVINEHLALTS